MECSVKDENIELMVSICKFRSCLYVLKYVFGRTALVLFSSLVECLRLCTGLCAIL